MSERSKPDFFDWIRGQLQTRLSIGEAVSIVTRVRAEVDAAERRWHTTQVRTRNLLVAVGVGVGAAAQMALTAVMPESFAASFPVIVVVAAGAAAWIYVAGRGD